MELAWLCMKGLRAVHWWLFSITQAEESSSFKKIYLDFFEFFEDISPLIQELYIYRGDFLILLVSFLSPLFYI